MDTAVTGVEAITTAVTNILNIATTMLDTITGNPILMLFFCVPIIGIAVGVVRKLRG